jgi:hypothetical protein
VPPSTRRVNRRIAKAVRSAAVAGQPHGIPWAQGRPTRSSGSATAFNHVLRPDSIPGGSVVRDILDGQIPEDATTRPANRTGWSRTEWVTTSNKGEHDVGYWVVYSHHDGSRVLEHVRRHNPRFRRRTPRPSSHETGDSQVWVARPVPLGWQITRLASERYPHQRRWNADQQWNMDALLPWLGADHRRSIARDEWIDYLLHGGRLDSYIYFLRPGRAWLNWMRAPWMWRLVGWFCRVTVTDYAASQAYTLSKTGTPWLAERAPGDRLVSASGAPTNAQLRAVDDRTVWHEVPTDLLVDQILTDPTFSTDDHRMLSQFRDVMWHGAGVRWPNASITGKNPLPAVLWQDLLHLESRPRQRRRNAPNYTSDGLPPRTVMITGVVVALARHADGTWALVDKALDLVRHLPLEDRRSDPGGALALLAEDLLDHWRREVQRTGKPFTGQPTDGWGRREVRRFVAEHMPLHDMDLFPEVAAAFLDAPDSLIRTGFALNGTTPMVALERLCTDTDSVVADAARLSVLDRIAAP